MTALLSLAVVDKVRAGRGSHVRRPGEERRNRRGGEVERCDGCGDGRDAAARLIDLMSDLADVERSPDKRG
jgi:hypothetical protein